MDVANLLRLKSSFKTQLLSSLLVLLSVLGLLTATWLGAMHTDGVHRQAILVPHQQADFTAELNTRLQAVELALDSHVHLVERALQLASSAQAASSQHSGHDSDSMRSTPPAEWLASVESGVAFTSLRNAVDSAQERLHAQSTAHEQEQRALHGDLESLRRELGQVSDSIGQYRDHSVRLQEKLERIEAERSAPVPASDSTSSQLTQQGVASLVEERLAQAEERIAGRVDELLTSAQANAAAHGAQLADENQRSLAELEAQVRRTLAELDGRLDALAEELRGVVVSASETRGAVHASPPRTALPAELSRLPDFASLSAGAVVVSSLTSPTWDPSGEERKPADEDDHATGVLSSSATWLRRLLRVRGGPLFHAPLAPPSVALRAGLEPGQCWPAAGHSANLTVRLAATIHPTAVTVEHTPASSALQQGRPSAPADFAVWAHHNEGDASERTLLGRFRYRLDDSEYAQTFTLPASAATNLVTDLVTLQILSNHGPDHPYTCLYRFRVHGKSQ